METKCRRYDTFSSFNMLFNHAQLNNNQALMKDVSSKVLPKNVLDYYLVLPSAYFSFTICGLPDTREARVNNIVKKDLEQGYIRFEEACIGSFNEFVLFKDNVSKTDVLAMTKYRGEMLQTLYLLEFVNGEWLDVKAKRFPELKDIQETVNSNYASFGQSTQQEINRLKEENNNNISIEFMFPEKDTVHVILNPELTNDETVVATIKWINNRFEIEK